METFGNVTLEALASGCPCVVEDKCGGHLVEHGQNGFTCAAGDFEGFYQATKRIVQDAALRKEMAKNARQGSWKFERHKIMQQMLENYKDAIARHRDPSFIKKRLQVPEAAGRNFISFICCNYWFVKTFAEPFLNTSHNVQSLVHGTAECVQRSRSRLSKLDLSVGGGGGASLDADEEHAVGRHRRGGTAISSSSSSASTPTAAAVAAVTPSSTSCVQKMLSSLVLVILYLLVSWLIYASMTI